MFCKYCGKELKAGSKYCIYCGKKLVTESTDSVIEECEKPQNTEVDFVAEELDGWEVNSEETEIPEQTQPEMAKHSDKRKKTGVAVVAACLFLVAAGGAAVSVHIAKEKEAETVKVGNISYDLRDLMQQEIPETVVQEQVIDLYAVTHQPSPRDLSKKWDSQLFYWLEDTDSASQEDYYLAKCKLFRTSLKRSDNNHTVDYEVYSDPKDGTIYKIVSIEILDDGTLELTDYYYKDGKPSFIFRRNDMVYTPTYASIDIPGERFYFEDDQMVKWRWIYEPQVVNQWILELEDTWYTQWAYTDISEEERIQFDEKETEMLNAAYNTLESIQSMTGEQMLEGIVVDLAGKPLEGVWVAVGDMDSGKLLVKMQTGTDGRYAWKPEEDGKYFLVFKKEGYEDTAMLPIWNSQGNNQKQDTIILGEKDNETSQVTFSVYQMTEEDTDSQKAEEQELMTLEQAEISVYPGLYYAEGEPIETIYSEASGKAEMSLKPGVYTVEVKKKGFTTLVTKMLVQDSEEMVSLYCIEEAKEKTQEKTPVWTVVLTWENPEKEVVDLDATMFIPQKGALGNMRYLNTRNREDGLGNCFLYDGDGETACEVLELRQPETGSYKYYVNDYSYAVEQVGNLEGLSNSNAVVQVYKNGIFEREFSVPSGAEGDIWEVFEIQNGELLPIQKLHTGGTEEGWWIQDKSRREWVEASGAWYYYSPTGLLETTKWLELDGNWYYVDEQGVMARNGWKEIDGKQYYFGEDGVMYENKAIQEEYILPESNTRIYTVDELTVLTPEQLRLARNEIYARHGRIFSSEDLKDYFSTKTWYVPKYSASEFEEMENSVLNEFELANRNLIVDLEEGGSGPNALAAVVAPYADSEEWGLMTVPHNPAMLIDVGAYYKLCNWEIGEATDGRNPQWVYRGDIYIPKDAKFDYIATKADYYGIVDYSGEYIEFENLSFLEYLRHVQIRGAGDWMHIFFDEKGNITGGESRIAG